MPSPVHGELPLSAARPAPGSSWGSVRLAPCRRRRASPWSATSSGSSSRRSTMCRRPARSSMRATLSRSPPGEARWRPCSSPGSPGACTLHTALGDDELGRRSIERLCRARGERPCGSSRNSDAPRRDACSTGRASARSRRSASGWTRAACEDRRMGASCTISTASTSRPATVESLAIARGESRVLVASPRARHALGQGFALDALVLSGEDEIELRGRPACRAGRRAGGLHRRRARRALSQALR